MYVKAMPSVIGTSINTMYVPIQLIVTSVKKGSTEGSYQLYLLAAANPQSSLVITPSHCVSS